MELAGDLDRISGQDELRRLGGTPRAARIGSPPQPPTSNAGKDAHVRVKRVDNAEVTMIRSWSAHERIAVKEDG
jgi:hypothetical protein